MKLTFIGEKKTTRLGLVRQNMLSSSPETISPGTSLTSSAAGSSGSLSRNSYGNQRPDVRYQAQAYNKGSFTWPEVPAWAAWFNSPDAARGQLLEFDLVNVGKVIAVMVVED